DGLLIVIRLDFTLQVHLEGLGALTQLTDLTLHFANDAADFFLLAVRQADHFGKLCNLVRLALLSKRRNRNAEGNQCGTDNLRELHTFSLEVGGRHSPPDIIDLMAKELTP